MKKMFSADRKTNRRDARCLCQFPDEVPIAISTTFLESLTVLGVMTSNGDVMPSHVFGEKEKVDTVVSLNMLDEVVKPWVEELTGGAAQTGFSTHPCHQEEPGVVRGQFKNGVKEEVLVTGLPWS